MPAAATVHFTPTSKADFGSPFGASVADAAGAYPDLFNSIAGGGVGFNPYSPGDQIREGAGATARYRDVTFAETASGASIGAGGFNPRVLPKAGEFGPLSPQAQSNLDAFYAEPLSELERSDTPEGRQALAVRTQAEWFLASRGYGPGAESVGSHYSSRRNDPTSIEPGRPGIEVSWDQGFEGQRHTAIPARQRFEEEFASRGLASAYQLELANKNQYRHDDSTTEFVDEHGYVYRVPPPSHVGGDRSGGGLPFPKADVSVPAGAGDTNWIGNTGGDLLLDYQNLVNRDRQNEFGPQTPGPEFDPNIINSSGVPELRPTPFDPPINFSERTAGRIARNKRRLVAAGAAGRGGGGGGSLGRGGLGLLNESQLGSAKLGS